MRTQQLTMVRPRSTAVLSLLNLLFIGQGQSEKTYLSKKWRILCASEQHVLNSNAVSWGAEKIQSWVITATATEGQQALLITAELS